MEAKEDEILLVQIGGKEVSIEYGRLRIRD